MQNFKIFRFHTCEEPPPKTFCFIERWEVKIKESVLSNFSSQQHNILYFIESGCVRPTQGHQHSNKVKFPADGQVRVSSVQNKVQRTKFSTVHYVAPYSIVLNCTVLCCTVLYFTVLFCTVLYCTVLYFTVLYCIVLYCSVLYKGQMDLII